MRVIKTDLERLSEVIAPLDTPETRQRYLLGHFYNAHLTADVSKRHRWGLYWTAVAQGFAFSNYSELYDSHIDTALRSVVPLLSVEK